MHAEQLRLGGLKDDEIQEASMMVNLSTGVSAYLHGIQYDANKFKKEVDAIVKHVKRKG